MTSRRTAGIAALVLITAGLFVMAYTAARSFPRGLIAMALLLVAMVAAWEALRRRGPARTTLLVVSILLLVGFVAVLMRGRILFEAILVAVLFALACGGQRERLSASTSRSPPPKRRSVRS